MPTRSIRGSIVAPPDASPGTCRRLFVELRDVSALDAPSKVVSRRLIENVPLEPNGEVEFQLDAPEVEPTRSLSLRVHASWDGSEVVARGDLLTTASCPIAASGEQTDVRAELRRV